MPTYDEIYFVFVVSKIVTDKTLIKKPSENQRADFQRVKVLVKKMKLLVFIEHGVLSLFSYGFLTPLAS